MSLISEFEQRRNAGNVRVSEQENLIYNRFFNLDTQTYKNGELSSKVKHLIGLSCSLMLRCNDCVIYHLKEANNAGANAKEINEAMDISLVIGGSIVIPHLRFALEALEELNQK